MMFKNKIVLFVCKIGDKYLAVSRKDNHQDFGFPGGKVENNETPSEAVAREVLEETGLKILNLKELTEKNNKGYHVTIFSGQVEGNIKTLESGIVKWVTKTELEKGSFWYFNKQLI